jgi:hypothetical protein
LHRGILAVTPIGGFFGEDTSSIWLQFSSLCREAILKTDKIEGYKSLPFASPRILPSGIP